MNKLRNATLYVLGLCLPLLFLPNIFADAFGLPKFILLILGVCVLLLLWAATVFQTNTLHWRATPFDVPLAALGGAYLLSTFIASPNKVAAITSPGEAGVVLLLVLLYFLIVQTAGETLGVSHSESPSVKKQKRPTLSEPALMGLVHAAVLMSLWTAVNVGLELAKFQSQLGGVQFPLANLSPLGSLLTQATFLGILLVYLSYRSYTTYTTYTTYAAPLALLIGLAATVYKLTQLAPFPLLPYRFGWTIALDSFKNAPIFGVGPADFISAFTRFKPLAINTTEYWNVTFGTSSNWYFHLLATVGALGLAAYLWLVYRSYKSYRTYKGDQSIALTLLVIFALQLFVPFNLPLLFVGFVVLSGVGIVQAGPAAAIRLVTVREGFVSVKTQEGEKVTEVYEEVEVEEETVASNQ